MSFSLLITSSCHIFLPHHAPSGYSVYSQCPLSRAYTIFRSLGLRHLPVVNQRFEVVGMLTRANFSERVL